MELDGKTYGTAVAGTMLLRHGDGPRRSATDRNRMAWYECANCGAFKMIRVQSVKPGTTISCGCVGRKQFIDHFEQRAANLPARTQSEIFKLARTGNKKKRLCIYYLMRRFKLSKYVIDFVIAAKCKALRALKGAHDAVINARARVERQWIHWSQKWYYRDPVGEKMRADREAFLAGLPHWRDRDAYLAAEAAENARIIALQFKHPMTAKLLRELLEGDAEVEFVDVFVPVAYSLQA
jgi:hypothetical protein